MDRILPLAERKKGVAIALEKAKQSETPARAATARAQPKTPAPAPAPRPGKASGGWRIQLGAFSKRSSAEALFKRLSTGTPIAGRTLHLVPKGAVTRLQVGPFESRAAAAAACSSLSARGQPCFPVAPAKP